MLRHLVVALLLVVVAVGCGAAPNGGPVNLNFESGSPGEVPPGWVSPTVRLGYKAELSTDRPKEGKQCVHLSGSPVAPPEPGRRPFGNVMQTIDATPYRGKTVRFRGAVRVAGAAATAALWMRVDRSQKRLGFFENMDNRPIRSAEWAYYEITGDVAADAEVLNIGMMLNQEGSAWLDDVTVEVLGKTEVRAGAARAVTPRGLENLVAFTRLFGLVRHFHPSDQAAAADWEAVAVNGAEAVEGARDASELAARLNDIFLPLAPSVRIYPANGPPPAGMARPEGATEVVAWEHNGHGNKDQRGQIYSSERLRRGVEKADARIADPLQPFRLDLGGGVAASIPLAVYADATGTLPRPAREAAAYSKAAYTGNDRATRLGAVVLAWNVLQHFYPYFDVVDADWPAELRAALRAAGEDRDEEAFLLTLRRMVASLDDGHGSVGHPSMQGRVPLPILWRTAGDALVVMAVGEGVTGLAAGDEVVAIDGRPVMQSLREAEALISGATPQWRRWSAYREIGLGAVGSSAALTVRNADASTRSVTVTRTPPVQPVLEKKPEKIAELKPGLWYLDLSRLSDADFDASLEKLAAARGIVFDLRGYPGNIGPKPLRHLVDSTIHSARWNVPILRRPDRAGVEWNTRGRWTLEPLTPRLTKNVVFLTDGRAISYAESWMGIVEAYKLGTIVGETTAGTNGNVNPLHLPGGYRIHYTGMKVLKHDGSRHHGVGIAPTVPVSPTIAGIRAGRDEQLEKAIEVLEK